jgi:hypothetical protein
VNGLFGVLGNRNRLLTWLLSPLPAKVLMHDVYCERLVADHWTISPRIRESK